MTPIQSTGSPYPAHPLTNTQSSLIQEITSVNIKHEQSQEKLESIEESLKELLSRFEELKTDEENSSRLSAIFSVLRIFLAKILFDTERYTKAFELIKQIAEQQKDAAVYYSSSRMNATDDIDKNIVISVRRFSLLLHKSLGRKSEKLWNHLSPSEQEKLLKRALESDEILELLKSLENNINAPLPTSAIDLSEKFKSAIEDMRTYLVKETARSKEEKARLAKAREDLAEKNFLDCVLRQLRAKEVEGADAKGKLAYIISNKKNEIKRLYLNRIQLNNLPENIRQYIGQFSHLKDLSLTHNELKNLPQELEKLRCLKYLDISNNYLSELPSFVNLLGKLKVLNISHNSFNTFPTELQQMRFIEFINFSHNKLTKIEFDCKDIFFYLEVLNLSFNELKHIPDALWTFHTLKSLDISNNKIRRLSAKIKECLHLEALYLSSNSLGSSLPDELWECRHLKRLDLTNSKITYLPKNISDSSQLVQLYLSNNILQNLPEGIKNCKQLKELYVKNNRPPIPIEIQNEIKQQLKKTQVVFS